MDVNTVDIFREGFQAPFYIRSREEFKRNEGRKGKSKEQITFGNGFRMSKHILPSSSIFGWYTGLVNLTFGGSKGYLQQQRGTSKKTRVATLSAPFNKFFNQKSSSAHLSGIQISKPKTPLS